MKNAAKEPSIKELTEESTEESFFSFLKRKENKSELLIFLICYFFIYVAISIGYGYPDSTADSGMYILSAETGIISGYRPIGYSWLIQFFHKTLGTYSGLFTGQYLLSGIAQLLFLYSIKYFFDVDKKLFYLLAACFILSPSILYCTNYAMSDSVFNSFTLLYLVTGLWLIKRVSILVTIFHFITLYLLFNIRYAALFYPVLSAIIFLLHVKKHKVFIVLAIIPLFLTFAIYKNIKEETKKVFGISEFSGFGGWLLANNAVSIIPYIDLKPEEIEDPELQIIHQIIKSYPDEIYSLADIMKTDFMWSKTHPGKKVLGYNMQTKGLSYRNAWIYTGTQFRKYGSYLIKKYPFEFTRYYLYENLIYAFSSFKIPHPEKITFNDLTKRYYGVAIDDYTFKYPFLHKFNYVIKITNYLLWTSLILSLLALVSKRSRRKEQVRSLQFLVVFLLMYGFFSIVACPVNNFRYLVPIYGIQLALPIIVLSNLLKSRNENGMEATEVEATS